MQFLVGMEKHTIGNSFFSLTNSQFKIYPKIDFSPLSFRTANRSEPSSVTIFPVLAVLKLRKYKLLKVRKYILLKLRKYKLLKLRKYKLLKLRKFKLLKLRIYKLMNEFDLLVIR